MSDPVSTHVLIEGLSIASLAAVSYVSTNLDNLVVLSAYGAKPGYRPLFVRLIFVFVCVTVLFISLALARRRYPSNRRPSLPRPASYYSRRLATRPVDDGPG